ncbi:hypothetical protein Pint_07620 [Pistacia integerrima]|uniref:Uncharacterized protein n=1 Tax=Pistacia integerrima TaxID=434235 RepID=A0ACC0XZE5_9ROSI|nr:hypothetical protein Pint_07620 [Pistacia integerrima]
METLRKRIRVKADVKEPIPLNDSGENQPLSPVARMFHEPDSNVYIIAIIGGKTKINPEVVKERLPHTLLRHPRFSSLQVNLDDHVIVPELDPNSIDSPDKFVEDYISNLSKNRIKMSMPMWDLHLLNLKTSDAESVGVFRIHHSLGDGASLMSLFLASTQKVSNPEEPPTLPMFKKVNFSNSSGGFWGKLIQLWLVMSLFWNTLVDVVMFLATAFKLLGDTKTPLKGTLGTGSNPRRIVHRSVCFDDIKLVRNAMRSGRVTRLTRDHQKELASFPSQTTLRFSNMPGPQEEISFYGHPVAYLAPSCYGQPNGLMIHVVGYANKMTFVLSVDDGIIPDPHQLCDDLEESLRIIKRAFVTGGLVKKDVN